MLRLRALYSATAPTSQAVVVSRVYGSLQFRSLHREADRTDTHLAEKRGSQHRCLAPSAGCADEAPAMRSRRQRWRSNGERIPIADPRRSAFIRAQSLSVLRITPRAPRTRTQVGTPALSSTKEHIDKSCQTSGIGRMVPIANSRDTALAGVSSRGTGRTDPDAVWHAQYFVGMMQVPAGPRSICTQPLPTRHPYSPGRRSGRFPTPVTVHSHVNEMPRIPSAAQARHGLAAGTCGHLR